MALNFAYRSQAAAAWLLYAFFGLLPVDWASAVGGWIGRRAGPGLRVSGNARRNLKRTFPDMDDDAVEHIVIRMWDNLGRTAGEHPHLRAFDPRKNNGRVEIEGLEIVEQLITDNATAIFVAGHIANWEMSPLAVSIYGLPVHLVYRRANNPFFDRIVQKGRAVLGGNLFPKGSEGAKQILKTLKQGEHMAMLVDQKMNDGISVPFLGRDAMTAPAAAELALRYDCRLIPVRVERLNGARFRVSFYPPLDVDKSSDRQTEIRRLTAEVNEALGEWIRERPAEWLWVHNRWPD